MERMEQIASFYDSIRKHPIDWATAEREMAQARAAMLVRPGEPSLPSRWTAELARMYNAPAERLEGRPFPIDPHLQLAWTMLPGVQQIVMAEMQRVRRTGEGGLGPHTLAALTQLVFFEAAWRKYGRRVYVIDPTTYDLLSLTDLPALPGSILRPPQANFYLRLPEGALRIPTPTSGERPLEGVWISFAGDDPEEPRIVQAMVTGAPVPGKEKEIPLSIFTQGVIFPDQPLTEVDLGSMRDLDLTDPYGIAESLPRVILGICLYLQSSHPALEPVPPAARKTVAALKNPAKRRKAESQNARLSRLGYTYVGGRETVADEQRVRDEVHAWKLDHQVFVRGHWRNQAHGVGRQERKLIFIEPHVRGPDLAEQDRIRASRVQPARRAAPKAG
jgi:hypothetical protein